MSVARDVFDDVPGAYDELVAAEAGQRLTPAETAVVKDALHLSIAPAADGEISPRGTASADVLAEPPIRSGSVADLSQPAPGSRIGHRAQRVLRMGAVDLCGVLLSLLIGHLVLLELSTTTGSSREVALDYVIAVPAFLLALALHGNYRDHWRRLQPSTGRAFRSMAQAFATSVLLLLALDAGLDSLAGDVITLTEACVLLAPTLVTVPLLRLFAMRTVLRNHRSQPRVLILGSGRVARSIAQRLRRSPGVRLVGLVDDDPLSNTDVLGTVAALPDIVAAQKIDRVIVAFSRTPQQETLLLLRALKGHVGISVVPRMYELLSWRASIEELHGIPLLHVAPQQVSVAARVAKRALDLTVASTLLVVSAPVLLAIAAVIRVTSPGPALFRQERIGRNGKPFQIYKFRTMVVDADDRKAELATLNEVDGPIFKMRQDPRVTRGGGLLRRTSMDEIPQLLNVIRGEMSLVGPRPFPPAEAARIGGWASTRFSVPPGITGLWQVSGRSELTNDDLLHLDSVYVSSWSFLWDLRILLRTPHAVLRREGAY